MPKRISLDVEQRAIRLYSQEKLSIRRVQEELKKNGINVGTNWIRRKVLATGIVRTHSQAMKYVMKTPRIECVCANCSELFLGKQVNEKYCKSCAPNLQAHKRIYLYGLSESKFQRLLEKQHHACAVCLRAFSKITTPKRRKSPVVVDHAHDVGHVRGLLCQECNVVVGYVEKRDPQWIDRIIRYLEETKQDVPFTEG